jgi:hypothetical protein
MGTVAAGAGVIGGTGAFTSVTAERTVSVETTSDGGAALALEPVPNSGNSDYVDEGDDTIAINLDSTDAGGFNKNATTILQNLIRVTNNGTQSVGSLTLSFDLSNISFSNGNPFKFTVSAADDDPTDDEKNTVTDGSNILTGNNSIPDSLDVGEAVDFGLVIDLIGKGNSSNGLPSQPDGYTLTISAEANPQN